MKKLIVLIAIGAGIWHWNPGVLSIFSSAGAYDDQGNPLVWIFTVDNCGSPCQDATSQLSARRVPFEEKRIDPDNKDDENVKLWKKMGRQVFPIIVSGNEKIYGSGSKPEITSLLGLNFGNQYLTGTEKRYFKKHFYADGSPKIVMYGADWCPFCKRLRDEFNAQNVDFVEIDVEKSGEKNRMSNTLAISGYPATWVGYTRVKGNRFKAVKSVLDNYM